MDSLSTSNIVTVAGWIAGPLVGTIIALVSRRRSERLERVLAWTIVAEAEIIKKEVGEHLPVKVSVDGTSLASLCIVRVQVGSSGYKPLEGLSFVIRFGEHARILHHKVVPHESKEFEKQITMVQTTEGQQSVCQATLPFLNLGQSVVFEFMISDYELNETVVDCAKLGVSVRRTSPARFEASLLPRGKAVSLFWSAFGISYDESPEIMRQIVEELRGLRRVLQQRGEDSTSARPSASSMTHDRTRRVRDVDA